MFYFTDIHGNIELFHHVVNWCKRQKPNCTIVFGGDAADRGEDGYQIMKEMLSDSQIIYLFGNHEQLFIQSAHELIGLAAQSDELWAAFHNIKTLDQVNAWLAECHGPYVNNYIWNGGFPTLRDWLFDGANEDILWQLEHLSRTYSYKNIDFCHAGGAYNAFLDSAHCERIILWDRDLLQSEWADNRICVHGHTPVQIIQKNCCRPLATYFNNNSLRIDMDCGTAFSNYIYVLNCDDMEITGFLMTRNGILERDKYKIRGLQK